ncbi:hypothetical protein TIFTF001_029649 [Ficus carica]|uniref:Helicase ATP-binding domain-containing protein n=1 Tax=Ficus carica TaxID=3494 RepID=A0AA88J2Q5_FICCA|nr:hypothetical protein TIFTF001_029649 [Ficus carica]
MRGTAARALQNLLRRLPSPLPSPTPTHSHTRLVGLSSRALSSAATAHITIDTTTRLDIDKEPNPRNPVPQNDFILHQKPTLLSFRHLGLGHRLTEAAKELGVLFPAEIHCAGIPPILKGKSLLLTSHHHSVGSFSLGVLTYLLPLIQLLREFHSSPSSWFTLGGVGRNTWGGMDLRVQGRVQRVCGICELYCEWSGVERLRRDAKSSTKKPKDPQAVVLCTTKELAEELLHVVKSILKSVTSKSKPTTENGQLESNLQEDASDVSIGLLVSTPGDVLQKIEEGSVVPSEIKYLVFDEVDDMFNHGLGSDIQKFLSPLKEHVSNSNEHSMQTILVTSMIKKTLHEDLSSLVEHLESSHAEVAGITVEVDQTEAFHLLESPEALKQKAVEVIQSLQPTS